MREAKSIRIAAEEMLESRGSSELRDWMQKLSMKDVDGSKLPKFVTSGLLTLAEGKTKAKKLKKLHRVRRLGSAFLVVEVILGRERCGSLGAPIEPVDGRELQRPRRQSGIGSSHSRK